jgi:hypothetical protein
MCPLIWGKSRSPHPLPSAEVQHAEEDSAVKATAAAAKFFSAAADVQMRRC